MEATEQNGEYGRSTLTEMRQAAEAVRADQREWVYEVAYDEWDDGTSTEYAAIRGVMQRWGAGEVGRAHHPADARFIATANPASVLALLDEVEMLREALGDEPTYATANRMLVEQGRETERMRAENDALWHRNGRLRAALRSVVESHERCAKIVSDFDEADAEHIGGSGA